MFHKDVLELKKIKHPALDGKPIDLVMDYYNKVAWKYTLAHHIEEETGIQQRFSKTQGINTAKFAVGYIIGTIFIYTAAFKLYIYVLKLLFR